MAPVRHLLMFLFAALAAGATADTVLWYGGDFDGVNGLRSERNPGMMRDANVYDDMDVSGGGARVTAVFGYFLTIFGPPSTAELEFRTGMTEGNGGNLVDEMTVPVESVYQGRYGELPLYLITAAELNVNLNPGRYWLSIAPISQSPFFLVTTSGTHGVGTPIGDGQSFCNWPAQGLHFTSTSDPRVLGSGTWDFAMGVRGTTVSEPTSSLLLGCAIFFVGRCRCRVKKYSDESSISLIGGSHK